MDNNLRTVHVYKYKLLSLASSRQQKYLPQANTVTFNVRIQEKLWQLQVGETDMDY